MSQLLDTDITIATSETIQLLSEVYTSPKGRVITSIGSDVFHTLDADLCLKFTIQWVWLESQFCTHWLKWPLSEVVQALENQ